MTAGGRSGPAQPVRSRHAAAWRDEDEGGGVMAKLRAPLGEEFGRLSDLCLRSKAVWGHDAAFLEACRAELTLQPDAVLSTHIQVADCDGTPVGVVQFRVGGGDAELLKLFVEPDRRGSGIGRLLLGWALASARTAGAARLTIESDPGAARFYEHLGADRAGSAASGSIPGRMLPRFVVDLRQARATWMG